MVLCAWPAAKMSLPVSVLAIFISVCLFVCLFDVFVSVRGHICMPTVKVAEFICPCQCFFQQ